MPETATITTPTISLQLYSVFSKWQENPDATLETLTAIGLTTVEAFDFISNPQELAATLQRHGIRAATGHAMFLSESNDQITVLPVQQTLEAAAEVGIDYLIDPFVHPDRWKSRDDIERTAELMANALEIAKPFNIGLGYHNHGHELALHVEDRPALEVFADIAPEDTRFEVDMYWAAAGGVDPAALVQHLGDRVVALHVKDGSAGADPLALKVPSGQTAAGQGEIPLTAALDAATSAKYAVIEFDQFDGDIFDGVAGSYAFLAERGLR